jgi:hypothetical protein
MYINGFFPAALVAFVLVGCQAVEEREARGFALPQGDVDRGQQAFVDLKCHSCHEVAGLENVLPRPSVTPMVDVVLGGLAVREPTDGELVTAILNPPHELYPGGEEERITVEGTSRMANYNDVITAQQLIDLVAFLHDRYETARPETD